MFKFFFFTLFFIFQIVVFSKEITISAAASLKEFMEINIEAYKKIDPSVDFILNTGSSGTLKKQLENGAPVDIIFLANRKLMKNLKDKNEILDEEVLLKNDLVLIKNRFNAKTPALLAIGDPSYVPAGKYASEALKNISLPFKYDLILCKDVRAVANYVDLGEVDYGIVYKTDVKILKNSEIIKVFPATSHSPIEYSIGISKNSKNIDEAKKFIDFLRGKKW